MTTCSLCGEPMPAGEEMFKYHGYSGPCPKPALRPSREPAGGDGLPALPEPAGEIHFGDESEEWVQRAPRVDSGPLYTADQMRDYALTALASQPSGAQGEWVLVPREPTPEMLTAAGTMDGYDTDRATADADHIAWWKDMLAAAPSAAPAVVGIDAMVDRFLCWRLPDDFAPDAGISFKPITNPAWTHDYWPTGTNLLHAGQARAMFEHCLAATLAAPGGGDAWADDDFYSGHALPKLHDDPAINAEILIQALTARLDTARRALADAAAMQVVQPALQQVKANAAWAMDETDPRRLLPRSVGYALAATPAAPGGGDAVIEIEQECREAWKLATYWRRIATGCPCESEVAQQLEALANDLTDLISEEQERTLLGAAALIRHATPSAPQHGATPSWANWIATDEGGEEHYFKDEPIHWPNRRLAAHPTPASTPQGAVATVCLVTDRYASDNFIEVQLQVSPGTTLPIGTKLYDTPQPAAGVDVVPVSVALDAVEHVGAANYASRVAEARRWIREAALAPQATDAEAADQGERGGES